MKTVWAVLMLLVIIYSDQELTKFILNGLVMLTKTLTLLVAILLMC